MMRKLKRAMILIFTGTVISVPVQGQEVFEEGRDLYASETMTISSEAASSGVVHVVSSNFLGGKLTITAGEESGVVFEYRELMKTDSRAEAIDYAKVIKASLEAHPDETVLYLQTPNPAPWSGTNNSGRVEGRLGVPPGSRLIIDASYMDLELQGPFRSVESHNGFGRADIEDVTDELNLSTNNRDIIASRIRGAISLTTSHADIILEDVNALDRQAFIRNENGKIVIGRLEGSFDIRNDFGRVNMEDIRLFNSRSSLIGSYTPIKMEIVDVEEAGLTIRNTNEDIDITISSAVDADFSLRVEGSGEINATGFKMKPTLVDHNRMDFVTGEGRSKIRMSVSGKGNINVEGQDI
jgi:hypothetical protein